MVCAFQMAHMHQEWQKNMDYLDILQMMMDLIPMLTLSVQVYYGNVIIGEHNLQEAPVCLDIAETLYCYR